MGLNEAIARRASRGAHVLIVEVPGWAETRMLLEAELDRRGWMIALSPADADVLAVCGNPGDELLAVTERVWAQLPGPRARMRMTTSAGLGSLLDDVAEQLADDPRQRRDALGRSRSTEVAKTQEDAPDPGDHGGMSHGGMDLSRGGMDHGDMSHGGMDHGGMDMMMPGGIPLAGGGDDRDGLEMDVLRVPLGPVLPHWPAGLVVDCVLQGDVIVSAEARVLGAQSVLAEESTLADDPRRQRVLRLLDLAVRLLAVAGWRSAAETANRLRRDVLANADLPAQAAGLDRLRRQVERSMLLRWSLRGIAPNRNPPGSKKEPGGDIRHRLIGWLREAADVAAKAHAPADQATGDADRAKRASTALADLPEMIRGADLGTARLLIAGLGLDTAALAESHRSAHD